MIKQFKNIYSVTKLDPDKVYYCEINKINFIENSTDRQLEIDAKGIVNSLF